MRRLAFLVFLLPAGCASMYDWQGEGYSAYYRHPAEETSRERIDRKEIVHWTDDPNDKERIGFLYKYRIRIRGSRGEREGYYIFDRYGATRVGFITDEGVFYRFDENGRLEEEPVGEYTIITTGLKVFFGIPLRENLDIEEIDPYK